MRTSALAALAVFVGVAAYSAARWIGTPPSSDGAAQVGRAPVDAARPRAVAAGSPLLRVGRGVYVPPALVLPSPTDLDRLGEGDPQAARVIHSGIVTRLGRDLVHLGCGSAADETYSLVDAWFEVETAPDLARARFVRMEVNTGAALAPAVRSCLERGLASAIEVPGRFPPWKGSARTQIAIGRR